MVRAQVMSAKKRYEVGLQKLAFTAEQVRAWRGSAAAPFSSAWPDAQDTQVYKGVASFPFLFLCHCRWW